MELSNPGSSAQGAAHGQQISVLIVTGRSQPGMDNRGERSPCQQQPSHAQTPASREGEATRGGLDAGNQTGNTKQTIW